MSDYISREAAIEAVREKFGCETCNGSNVGIICTFCDVGEAILMIKNIPTADVEPVRRGRWKRYSTTMMECSLCGKHTARHKFNYCPNCWAKMDLEDENGT